MKPDKGKRRVPHLLLAPAYQPAIALKYLADFLELEARHRKKIHAIRKAGVTLEEFDVDCIEVVMKVLAVPPDDGIGDVVMNRWFSQDLWTRPQIERYLLWIQREVARWKKR
jgi:hypothetical protein